MIGLWPAAEQNVQEETKNKLLVFVTFLLMSFGIVFPYTHSLIKMHSNIEIIIEHVRYILPTVVGVMRLLILWWKKKVMKSLMDMMIEDWLKYKNQEERSAMIMWIQKAHIIFICGYAMVIVVYVAIVILPVLGISTGPTMDTVEHGKMLPLSGYYIYGITKWPQYQITYLSNAIFIFFCSLTITGVDNFLGLLVFHVCGQYEILRLRLTYLNILSNIDDLKSCVMKHIRLIRAVAMIEELYNIIILAVFFNFAVLFALYGFLILSLLEERNDMFFTEMLHLVNVIVIYLVYMAVYCAVGEILITQCDKVYYALCSLQWYSVEPKKARDLILCMLKFKEPSNITAGRIFPMTMITFSNIMKTSTGYISVLFASTN